MQRVTELLQASTHRTEMTSNMERKNYSREAAFYCCGLVGISGCERNAGLVCPGFRDTHFFVAY